MGVPLDDTWIHFQFADNFSKGFFFQYNPGELTAGTTSPLYVVILGTFNFLFGNFMISSLILSFAFYILSCFAVYKISFFIFSEANSPLIPFSNSYTSEYISLIITMLTVFSGRIAWASLSGMETTIFIFFCLAGVYSHIKNLKKGNFTLLPALMFAFASVSRPEGYLLSLFYFLDFVLNMIYIGEFKKKMLMLISSLILYSVITVPYLVFSYLVSGDFFPNTFRGQGGFFRFVPEFEFLRIAAIYFFRDNFITAMLYFFSIVYYLANIKKYFSEFRYVNLIFLWIIILPVALSVLVPNWRHHVRYLIPLIPYINFASVWVLLILLNSEFLAGLKNIILRRKYLISFIVLFSFIYYIVFALALGKNTDNINDQQVYLAGWVRDNVKRNETIAVNDIGAITFISKNRVIDMAGLITPEVLNYRKYQWKDNLDSLNLLLKNNKVTYLIIYDNWFKEYLREYGNELTFITSAVLEDNTICGGIEMKVYKTNF